MSASCLEAVAVISTLGGFILCGMFGHCLLDNFGPVMRLYLSKRLEFDIQKRQAEHEAKIKLIKGLD